MKNLSDARVSEAVEAAMTSDMKPVVGSISVFRELGPQGTARNPATSRAAITFSKKPVMRRSAYAGMLFNGAGRPIDPSRPAPTITASAGGNKTHIIDEEQVFGSGASFGERYHRHLLGGGAPGSFELPTTVRRLTINESAAFQGFPDGFRFHGKNSSVYRQIGNAVPVGLAAAVAMTVRGILSDIPASTASESIAA